MIHCSSPSIVLLVPKYFNAWTLLRKLSAHSDGDLTAQTWCNAVSHSNDAERRQGLARTNHLMRRAGFGAAREELEQYVAKGYDATVEELIDPPDDMPAGNMLLLLRFRNHLVRWTSIPLRRTIPA